MDNDVYLGCIIRFLREQKGFGLRDMKNLTGISITSLSNIEKNINNPTINTLEKICGVLGVTVRDILALRDKVSDFVHRESFCNYDVTKIDEVMAMLNKKLSEKTESINTDFLSSTDVIMMMLNARSIMNVGGYDINSLTDN